MKPYYDHAGITIYHGDCREILPQIDTVSAVITDPPYGINYSKYESHTDREEEYQGFIWEAVTAAESKLESGWFVLFQAEKHCTKWASWFPREWRLFALPKAFGQIGREPITRMTDYALYWSVGDIAWPKVGKSDHIIRNWFVSNQCANTANRPDHPCPRPIDTMEYLVDCFCAPGKLLIDPFMGSGTTLRAAKDLGRKAIGIEIEEKYCEIAAKRMAQEVLF